MNEDDVRRIVREWIGDTEMVCGLPGEDELVMKLIDAIKASPAHGETMPEPSKYVVRTRNDSIEVSADRVVMLDHGALYLERDGVVIAAFAPGTWEHFAREQPPEAT